MVELLKASFTKEQISLALAIGAQVGETRDKILELFSKLDDPLLAAADVRSLLGISESVEYIADLMNAMVGEALLEKSEKTQRPLDEEGVVLFRKAGTPFVRLRLIAMESRLPNNRTRYQFTCDGRLIRALARIDRLDALSGTGQQREEIHSHVNKIAEGIASGVQVPNPVLVVLLEEHIAPDGEDDAPESFIRVRSTGDYERVMSPLRESDIIEEYRPVVLDFPYRRAAFDEEKSALLVDGQQRTAALSLVDVDAVPRLMLSVNAEIATEEDARRIFLVANSTKKIETQFSRALMATMEDTPGYLSNEKPRAVAAKRLAIEDSHSPFFQIVQYPGVKFAKRPFVAYNSLFQVITQFAESSLPKANDEILIHKLVSRTFTMVKKMWSSAWNVKPTESRLMHGVGLRAMSIFFVSKLEGLVQRYGDLDSEELWDDLDQSMRRLQPQIVWRFEDTGAALKAARTFYEKKISDKQNTFQDIMALSKEIKTLSLELDTEAAKGGKAKK